VGNNGHFIAVDIDGDLNNINTSQLNDSEKKAFISAQGDDNDIDVYQWGSGSHYTEIAVGSDQTVDVTQDGSGNHNASISMSGYESGLDLTQDSSTGQVYSINQNCVNANGCGTTTITQN
jgi:predicted heme/steroid binding protein